MAPRVSGKRYAEALFQLASDNGQIDQWADDLSLVTDVLQDDDFRTLMKHADVHAADKLRATASVLGSINPLVRNMVDLLVSKGLVDAIRGVQQGYAELLDQHLGRQRVEVTTAVPLEDSERERIATFVSGLVNREVVTTTTVDESILGGVVIQIGDRLLDGSTQAKLTAMRNQLHAPT